MKWPQLIDKRMTAQVFLQLLPFADAATEKLPLSRLLRLSLFQVSVGMTMVLLTGTLNRVMIVELGVSATLVAIMVSLPMLSAPARALIGFRSDTHKSYLGWRRVPFMWFGAMLTFGGLAIMPFALINLTPETNAPPIVGQLAAALAFLLAGAGIHMSQTAGLALASDLSNDETRPRVVALLYVMLLVGMVVSALVLGQLLVDVTPKSLIQVIQGCALVVVILNHFALYKQEPRNMELTAPNRPRPSFGEAWKAYRSDPQTFRLLAAVALGSAAFGMQDVLLEPYGGEVLRLSVSSTTALTAFMAAGSLVGFGLAARFLGRGIDACRIAAFGGIAGIAGFVAILLSGPIQMVTVFQAGTALIGLGGGLFAVGTLTAAMAQAQDDSAGLALGAWGAVQVTAMGLAMATGGAMRDGVRLLADQGVFGSGFDGTAIGYVSVYHLEILLLFAAIAVIGPLARHQLKHQRKVIERFGITETPG